MLQSTLVKQNNRKFNIFFKSDIGRKPNFFWRHKSTSSLANKVRLLSFGKEASSSSSSFLPPSFLLHLLVLCASTAVARLLLVLGHLLLLRRPLRRLPLQLYIYIYRIIGLVMVVVVRVVVASQWWWCSRSLSSCYC